MLTTILLGAFLPALLTGSFVLGSRAIQSRHRILQEPAAPAIAIGFATGQFVIIGLPAFPPVDVTHWLPYVAIGGAAVAFSASCVPSASLSFFLRLGALALVLRFILGSMVQYHWGFIEAVIWILGLTAALVPLWWLPSKVNDRLPGWLSPIVLLVVTIATSGALVFGRSALLGQLAGCLASSLGALAILSLVFKSSLLERPGVYVWVLLVASLWAGGYFYAELPVGPVLLLWATPMSVVISSLLQKRGWNPMRAALAGLTVAIVLSASALLWGYAISEQNAVDDMYDSF